MLDNLKDIPFFTLIPRQLKHCSYLLAGWGQGLENNSYRRELFQELSLISLPDALKFPCPVGERQLVEILQQPDLDLNVARIAHGYLYITRVATLSFRWR